MFPLLSELWTALSTVKQNTLALSCNAQKVYYEIVIFASKTSCGMLLCLTQFSTVRQARIRQDDVKARTVSDTSHEVEMTQQ